MGSFVLGILVGWLAEWFFYTFWVKAGEGNDGDCSAIKAELELKNRQISSLQTQLTSASESTQSKPSSSASMQSAVSATSKESTAPSVSTTILSSDKASSKAATKSSVKAKTGKASNTASAKSPKAKSSTIKKVPAPKNTVIKNTETKSSAKSQTKVDGDDFTKLTGIGPSMSAILKSLGVDTFEKLAATDDDILRDMLEASGARMNNNKEAMDSWNEQATVAATGDFKALKAMQAALKS